MQAWHLALYTSRNIRCLSYSPQKNTGHCYPMIFPRLHSFTSALYYPRLTLQNKTTTNRPLLLFFRCISLRQQQNLGSNWRRNSLMVMFSPQFESFSKLKIISFHKHFLHFHCPRTPICHACVCVSRACMYKHPRVGACVCMHTHICTLESLTFKHTYCIKQFVSA